MSTEGMIDVEVPENGTVIVVSGDVYEVDSDQTDYVMCTCRDGKHAHYARVNDISPGQAPHVVGVQTVQIVWDPK